MDTTEYTLSTMDVVKMLNISRQDALYRAIKRGEIKYIRLTYLKGQPYRFRPEDIQEYINKRIKVNPPK